jgi:hypothetical protein
LDDTQLSESGLLLELHRAQITDRRVSAFRVVEALDIVKHVCLCFIAMYVLLLVRSVFSDEKKLSIAALSHTLPDRLIEQTTPLSAISRWNCSLVYWVDSSVRRNAIFVS